jgi:ATP-binding cassette subfamily A (ABC1) protein 3
VQIPDDYSSKFAAFFDNLENNLKELKILGFGISLTTLEDVFMKIGHLTDPA